MKGKKWCILFLSALALTFALWGGINILTDPFGVFGDPILSWDSYSQTLNPRIGKTATLADHWDDYDSYIVGSSSAASYLPQTLEQYTDGSYYNLFHYGADIAYDEQLISWLLRMDDVKHIVLVLGLNEANLPTPGDGLTARSPYTVTGESPISYYFDFLFADLGYAREKITSRAKDTAMPQPFDVFLPEYGTYDKRLRDAEPISTLEDYLAKHGGDFIPMTTRGELTAIDACTEAVGRIRTMCDEAKTELTVILSPVSAEQLGGYTNATLNAYFEGLAKVTDYYNFGISPVSFDPRYFYDTTHTRNAAADMVLAKIYGDSNAYYPDHFGVKAENGTFATAELLYAAAESAKSDYTVNVPVLLYHHLDPNAEESGTVLHPDTFARQMALLRDNGYTAVSLEEVIAYAEKGEALPQKPVVITFDDGYLSNYEYAFPILRDFGWKGTIFTIGTSVGHTEFYKDTDHAMIPHFGKAEIEEMTSSGVISIQSHTYDMHMWAPFEEGIARETILPLDGESEGDYIAALTADIEQMNGLFAELGLENSTILAFPQGKSTLLTDVILREHGFKATLTTDFTRTNCIVKGLPQSLIDLGRLNISGDTTDEEILAYCGK